MNTQTRLIIKKKIKRESTRTHTSDSASPQFISSPSHRPRSVVTYSGRPLLPWRCFTGVRVVAWLASVPGASNIVLEVIVPYSRMSMIQLLGKESESITSIFLEPLQTSSPVVGVGFTGSLATARPKLGDHRFYLSTRTSNRLWASSVTLSKGLRTRDQEERVSSQVLLKAIADACKVQSSLTFDSDLTEDEVPDVTEQYFEEDQELEQLIQGKICFKIFPFSNGTQTSNGERKVILSGSFNPLHDGHLKLREVAMSLCGGGYPCIELSAINADKPPLTVAQIKDRVKQFEKAVIISSQPYFYKKAEIFPGSAFVIGADTAARLINEIKDSNMKAVITQ
ncbi:hypothetical protein L2E82_05059 [Cichorium intybus]|uniref:Uncharacterized protein n=1 Tax=Cichorium intybus TaxID=13427 RepID=A0ACB9H827_CICIN|nr:hypothetical protein L2E82_05059 [Cichorium intybus]